MWVIFPDGRLRRRRERRGGRREEEHKGVQ